MTRFECFATGLSPFRPRPRRRVTRPASWVRGPRPWHALLVAKNEPVARVVGLPRGKHPAHLRVAGHPADATHVTADVWHGTALTLALLKRRYFGWQTLRDADRGWAGGRVHFTTDG